MKRHFTAIALLTVLAIPAAQAAVTLPYVYTSVAAQPQSVEDQEIAGLFSRWNSALQTGKPDVVVSLYAQDAVLQPTVSNRVRTTPTEIKEYFEHFLVLKPVGQINYRQIRHFGPDTAMDSGVYTFALTSSDGSVKQVQARYTFLYEKVNGEWKIINHHSSAMPEQQPQMQAKH